MSALQTRSRRTITTKVSPRDDDGIVRCYIHNHPAASFTSNTEKNPNRKFWKCSYPELCNFWEWDDCIPSEPRPTSRGPGLNSPPNSQEQTPAGQRSVNSSRTYQAQRMTNTDASPPISPSKRERGLSPPRGESSSRSAPVQKRSASSDVQSSRLSDTSHARGQLSPADKEKRNRSIAQALQTGLAPVDDEIDTFESQGSFSRGASSHFARRDTSHSRDMAEAIPDDIQTSQEYDAGSTMEVEIITGKSRGSQANFDDSDAEQEAFWSSPSRKPKSPIASHHPQSTSLARSSRHSAAIPENSSSHSAQFAPVHRAPTTPRHNAHAHDGNHNSLGTDSKSLLTPPNSSQADHGRVAYSTTASTSFRHPNEVPDTPTRTTKDKGKGRELPMSTTPAVGASTSNNSSWLRVPSTDLENPFPMGVPTTPTKNKNGITSVPVTPATPGALTAEAIEESLQNTQNQVLQYIHRLERKFNASQQSLQRRNEKIKELQEENARLVAKARSLETVVESLVAQGRESS
ncbi:hypothetical protein NLI96_g12971 [Meripilus lineatus]|uniref:GRF-type domain-containing protein n=1 Tax=Meripilus lineatus TaxID=2056292 RepID=A0AAD5Y748_9APHY|nr:hypothetical protein NLI96_g12971 [Physisporinus lineatus]